jgi:hypothetical protein
MQRSQKELREIPTRFRPELARIRERDTPTMWPVCFRQWGIGAVGDESPDNGPGGILARFARPSGAGSIGIPVPFGIPGFAQRDLRGRRGSRDRELLNDPPADEVLADDAIEHFRSA